MSTNGFPTDALQTSDYLPNSAIHRLKTQSTYLEADALKRIVATIHPREVMVGMRGNPDGEPRMTFVVRAGSDAYIADDGDINIEREMRESEVLDVLKAADAEGCSILIASRLLPHTKDLRPSDANGRLANEDVLRVADAATAIKELKKVLGR